MDWIKKFCEDFKDNKNIKDLEEEKFFGYLQLNFLEGKVTGVNKFQTIKPNK